MTGNAFMPKKRKTKILFIGNSHTYIHYLPAKVHLFAKEEGYECDVVMLAHPNWYLKQHVEDHEARFNIRYGHYDYVVLQEHAHPFDHIEEYKEAAETLAGWIRDAGGVPVIFGTWARKDDETGQELMNEVHRSLASDLNALYAPAGESWWSFMHAHPETGLYEEDGAHASERGTEYAAGIIWTAVKADF